LASWPRKNTCRFGRSAGVTSRKISRTGSKDCSLKAIPSVARPKTSSGLARPGQRAWGMATRFPVLCDGDNFAFFDATEKLGKMRFRREGPDLVHSHSKNQTRCLYQFITISWSLT
jgi:hypothetical protein